MATEAKLTAVIEAEDKASATIAGVGKNLDGLKTKTVDLKKGFQQLAVMSGVAFGAIATVVGVSITKAAESAGIHAQLNAVLKSTGGVAGVTAQAAEDLAESLKKVTVFDDDAIISAENLLLTFTKVGKTVFPEATRTVLDMSKALGQDTKSSAIQLGKALQDPIRGVATLRKVGVNFSEDQLKVIQHLVDTGDLLGAQKIILAELHTEFGNSANINDFGDKMTKVKQGVDDVEKAIGKALIPIVEKIYEKLKPIIDSVIKWIEENPKLVAAILIFAGVLSGLTLIISLLAVAIFTLDSALLPAIISAGIIVGILGFLALAVWAVWNIVQILYKDWDLIWLGIKTIVQEKVDAIKAIWTKWMDYLENIWTRLKNGFRETWNDIKQSFIDAWNKIKEVALSVFDAITKFLDPIINTVNKLIDKLVQIGKSVGGTIKNTAKGAWDEIKYLTNINDGIVQNGRVITTNPEDYIIATKTPGSLGGGKNINININGAILTEDAARIMGDMIISKLRMQLKF